MHISRDAVRRTIRTFLITSLALFVPGLLGWLNDLTAWARAEGATPFPDAHGLAYLGVVAIVAGVVAVVNLLWTALEDSAGFGVLRTPVPPPAQDQGGRFTFNQAVIVIAVAFVVTVALVVYFNP